MINCYLCGCEVEYKFTQKPLTKTGIAIDMYECNNVNCDIFHSTKSSNDFLNGSKEQHDKDKEYYSKGF